MKTLFNITADLDALADMLTEVGGEIGDDEQGAALEAWWQELGEERDKKIDNYCALIEELNQRTTVRASESERLANLAEVDRKAADRLKIRLREFLESQSINKLKTDRFNLTVAKNGGKAPLAIPDEWRNEPATAPEQYHRRVIRLDVDAIRTDLESGRDVPGCRIEERGTHLRIK
jgi:hypothetical protein